MPESRNDKGAPTGDLRRRRKPKMPTTPDLPYNREAEIVCIGAAIIDPAALEQIVTIVVPADFFMPAHQKIAEMIFKLYGDEKAVDVTSVCQIMDGQLGKVNGIPAEKYLADLAVGVPGSASAVWSARRVAECSRVRQFYAYCQEAGKHALADPEVFPDVLADHANRVEQLRASGRLGSYLENVCLAKVEPKSVSWLWPGRIPLGKLTLFCGDPSLGKSCISLDIAARITTDGIMPDGRQGATGRAALLSAEDDAHDTIRPRCDLAGADVSKVHLITGIRNRGESTPLALDEHIPHLRRYFTKHPDIRLLIVDPLDAFAGATDGHRSVEVRKLLAPLKVLAEDFSVAIVGIKHLSKSGGSKAVYRSLGSIAWIAAARVAWYVQADADDPGRRLFLSAKNNLVADCAGMAYRLHDEDGWPHVAWEAGEINLSADAALANEAMDPEERAALVEAAAWLRTELQAAPRAVAEVKTEAKKAGFSESTLRRAARKVGVKVHKSGFGGKWTWGLP